MKEHEKYLGQFRSIFIVLTDRQTDGQTHNRSSTLPGPLKLIEPTLLSFYIHLYSPNR